MAEQLWIMTSAGGMWPLAKALEAPVGLALSGPAGGVRAAAVVAAACGFPGAISLDMGGTSTDVCLITGGEPAPAAERDLVGHPVRLPSLDVVTIGAGGGSIGSIDSGGAVAVGPRSAGAVPGPVAYGRGGTEPTVTDANVALGRIPTEGSGALGDLDVAGAAAALSEAGLSAQGLLDVVTANMERASQRQRVTWHRSGRVGTGGVRRRRTASRASWPRRWAWRRSSSRRSQGCCLRSAFWAHRNVTTSPKHGPPHGAGTD